MLAVIFGVVAWAAGVAVGDAGAAAAGLSTAAATAACAAFAGLEEGGGDIHEMGMFVYDQASGDCLEGNSSCGGGRPKV